MCNPAIAVGMMAVMAAGQAFMQSEQQRAQQQGQANAARAQAQAAANEATARQQQADIELQKGEMEKRRLDTERDTLHRAYQERAGTKRSLLAAGNVDIASGSAADSLLGDAALLGEDMATNSYTRSLADWQAAEKARQARWEADQLAARSSLLQAQASWIGKSAGSLGDSLLSAGIAGAGRLGSYSGVR